MFVGWDICESWACMWVGTPSKVALGENRICICMSNKLN